MHFFLESQGITIGESVHTTCGVSLIMISLFHLFAGAFGTLGVGGGFALGAKLCRPESEVSIL